MAAVLTDSNFETEVLKTDKLSVIDFWAPWCGPCKMMPPILHEVKNALGDAVTIIKVDVDKNNNVAYHYQIQGVPTLAIFKNGEIKWRQSGVVPAKQLQNVIQQYM